MRRSSTLPVKLAVAVVLAATSGAAAAAAPKLSEMLEASGITLNGYAAASYYYSSGLNAFHTYDVSRDGLQIDQVGFAVGFQPKEGFGGFLNVIAGEDARLQNAFELSRVSVMNNTTTFNNSDTDTAVNITQAYVQYAGSRFTAIAGKFVTLVGAEVIDPRGDYNFSRSLLFNFEPSTHTGVRVTVPIGDTLSLIAGVNNGFNITSASYGSKLAEVGVSFAPTKLLTLTAQGYFGKDPVLNARREFADIVATLNLTDSLTVVASVDYQHQRLNVNSLFASTFNLASAPSGDNEGRAVGGAAYVNYKLNSQWRIAVRGEYFDDHDGLFTVQVLPVNAPNEKISEGTVTLGYSPSESYEVRLEGRYDHTSDRILPKFNSPNLRDNQAEYAIQALYKF